MAREPIVTFGLMALTAAKTAKCGGCDLRTRLALALAVLNSVRDDDQICVAVVDFLNRVEGDPVGAGEVFDDFLSCYFQPYRKPPEVYDWQERADLQ